MSHLCCPHCGSNNIEAVETEDALEWLCRYCQAIFPDAEAWVGSWP